MALSHLLQGCCKKPVLFVPVELANVGPLYKLRVRHDNSKQPFSDWHLEKVLSTYCIVSTVCLRVNKIVVSSCVAAMCVLKLLKYED